MMRRTRRAVERDLRGDDRPRARRLLSGWRMALSPLTVKARLGLEAARGLVQAG